MFNFGDELIIDSYRIPWLIWIQLLAMFLLVILVYIFTTAPSDLSLQFSTATATATATASASQSATALSRTFLTFAPVNTYQNCKVRENEIKETEETSTSGAVERAKNTNGVIRQRATTVDMDEGNSMVLEHSYHPCHFFGVAKQAFLKCLGIDSGPENFARKKQKEKDD